MSLPRYPEYKDSGVEWLGSIPAHWQTRRTKFLFELMKRPVAEGDGIVTAFRDGQVTLRSNRRVEGFTNAVQEVGYQGVRAGDLVIHAMDAFAGAIGVSDSDGKSTPVYSVCRARSDRANPHYYAGVLRYMALGGFINSLAKGVRERSTDFRWVDAATLELPLPPLAEQSAICKFINRQVARIDSLIAEQEKLLALLAEKRQATISHAVTRGLDPNVPMKDPGIDWLGEVPAHWEVVTLRRVVEKFEQGWSPECESRTPELGEWGVLKAGCVNGGVFSAGESKALPSALAPRSELEVRAGDVLMSRASGSPKLIGSVAFLDEVPPRLMLSDKVFRLSLSSSMSPRFFALSMGSNPMRQQIEVAIGGAEGLANNLPQSSIKDFWIALPPEKEQGGIIAKLTSETARLDEMGDAAKLAVTLLKERRSAMISAAVTGQIDVRAVVEPEAA